MDGVSPPQPPNVEEVAQLAGHAGSVFSLRSIGEGLVASGGGDETSRPMKKSNPRNPNKQATRGTHPLDVPEALDGLAHRLDVPEALDDLGPRNKYVRVFVAGARGCKPVLNSKP